MFPAEQIDVNASRLQRELRRLLRMYRGNWVSAAQSLVAGNVAVNQSAANMYLNTQSYLNRYGVTLSVGAGEVVVSESVAAGTQRWQRVIQDAAATKPTSNYWVSVSGLTRRVDLLSQDMNYQVVADATKQAAAENGVPYVKWVTAADERVCPECVSAGRGGDGYGNYREHWHIPSCPLHVGCRCQLMLYLK